MHDAVVTTGVKPVFGFAKALDIGAHLTDAGGRVFGREFDPIDEYAVGSFEHHFDRRADIRGKFVGYGLGPKFVARLLEFFGLAEDVRGIEVQVDQPIGARRFRRAYDLSIRGIKLDKQDAPDGVWPMVQEHRLAFGARRQVPKGFEVRARPRYRWFSRQAGEITIEMQRALHILDADHGDTHGRPVLRNDVCGHAVILPLG